ncbi:Uncharacterised protein [Chlamydia trachomatis]|nr:Uncharacterised protein [Chlamydia trachomatis]
MPVCQMPFIIANEISEEEKTAWHNARLAEVAAGTYKGKEITPDFEPIERWKPFEDIEGSSAAIISYANQHKGLGIYPGDYIKTTVDGDSYKFIIVKTNFSSYGGADSSVLLIADHHMSTKVSANSFGSWADGDYRYSYIHKECEKFYSKIPWGIRKYVCEQSVPYLINDHSKGKSDWILERVAAYVFIPSGIELCNDDSFVTTYVPENEYPNEFIKWPTVFSKSLSNLKAYENCWLRDFYSARSLGATDYKSYALYVYLNSEAHDFNLDTESGLAKDKKYVLPCFCIR